MAQQVPRSDARAVAGRGVAAPATSPRVRWFLSSLNLWFWAIVGVPTLLAGVYYFGIASDRYLSEVKFVVRDASKPPISTSGIAGILGGGGLSQGDSDNYAVQEYIMSRDAVRRLDHDDDLRTMLAPPGADIISRFPGVLYWRDDFEALYKAYPRFVSVDIDSSSGISTLDVEAYTPEDAQRIAKEIVNYSEQLVNELNERSREDSLKAFTDEVAQINQQITSLRTQMTSYRIKQQFLDPKSAATGPVDLLAQLNAQETDAKRQLDEMARNAPSSQQIPLLRTRIATLDKLITDQREKITGDNDSLAAKEDQYERLNVDVDLMGKELDAALSSLQSAKLEVQRQQLYLEVITAPNLADYPLYPRRTVSFLIVLATCLVTYGIAWLLVANVREHAAA